jgi:putative redox protein
MGRTAAGMLPELAEHLSHESGWTVASGTMSGVGEATGTFSATQWRHDVTTMVDHLFDDERPLALAGFGLGGCLSLRIAADDERIRGVATFATSAHLDTWCGNAEAFASDVARAGVVEKGLPLLPPDALLNDVLSLDPLGAVATLPPRRLLIGHGADDRDVPVQNARDLYAAANEHAELRIIHGAGHWLRADPRMVATLLGWMDRH